jgi:hypothetical protein
MVRLGMPVSDTTILRSVKKSVTAQTNAGVVRVVGVDEWAWRKGTTFGTVIVDLERRQVVELLADRSAATTADWLSSTFSIFDPPGRQVITQKISPWAMKRSASSIDRTVRPNGPVEAHRSFQSGQ